MLHHSEKIVFYLREIIKEEDQHTRVTLLEYLKQLHPVEWDNFVKDTKILAEESNMFNGQNPFGGSDEKSGSAKTVDDLPFYCIGFKRSAPEFTLRTRIWASLRTQTLCRTVSSMMNYAKAIKLLYRVKLSSSLVEIRISLNVSLNVWRVGSSILIFLCNVIQSSTPFNVRIPNSCYLSVLICGFLTLMRNQYDAKAVRRDCSLL